MNVLIDEDETLAADTLKRQLTQLSQEVHQVHWSKSLTETLSFLTDQEVDLILLDIQLADGISFELFERGLVVAQRSERQSESEAEAGDLVSVARGASSSPRLDLARCFQCCFEVARRRLKIAETSLSEASPP